MAGEAIVLKEGQVGCLKLALARLLAGRGYSQKRVSEVLNLTQPMVSNYLSSQKKADKSTQEKAEIIMNKIEEGAPISFSACVNFNEKPAEGHYYLADKDELVTDDRQAVVGNIIKALNILRGYDLSLMVPKVKVNIAMAKHNPQSKNDVAAVAGGLSFIGDRLSYFGAVGYGSSTHLASLLLYLINKKKFGMGSIMNVKYDQRLTRFPHAFFSEDYQLKTKSGPDILFHKGGFGLEPCAYIIGKDAVDVVKKLGRFLEVLDGK